MHPKTRARHGALAALVAVEQRDAILGAALDDEAMPPEALPFARELASGVLRHRAHIDYTLAPLLKTPLKKLDPPVRAALRLAAYERAYLGTMAAAVADEYAEATRAARKVSAVGFVNAVARKLPAAPRALGIELAPWKRLAIEYSHPDWLVRRWLKHYGAQECAQLLAANNSRAPLALRVNTLRARRPEVRDALLGRGLDVCEGALSPDALLVTDAGSPLGWPEWKSGQIIAQDEAAQVVGRLCAPQPGWLVLDAAAAPGGKTTHLAQLMHNSGRIVAGDLAPGRLKLVRDNAARLGVRIVETVAGDLREVAASLALKHGLFDVVLLDAPCLGTGTLRRRPDAKWKKTAEQLAELVELQARLLDSAASLVKPGGALVYATCSLEPEENELQVQAFGERHMQFGIEPGASLQGAAAALIGDDGFLRTMPHRQGCDGAFAARLVRQVK